MFSTTLRFALTITQQSFVVRPTQASSPSLRALRRTHIPCSMHTGSIVLIEAAKECNVVHERVRGTEHNSSIAIFAP